MVTSIINEKTNPKQVVAFNAIFGMVAYFEACKAARLEGRPVPEPQFPYDTRRQFFYGGAIRGGKTFLYLTILLLLAKRYPGSRWHVVRASFPDLQRNVEPSIQKIVGTTPVRWRRSNAEYYVQLSNGSRIFLLNENFKQDRDLNRFKGLETNGFLLEQMEELQYDTYQKAIERAGSWYIPDMPPSLVLGTFNPAYNWVKEVIYDAYTLNGDSTPFHYTRALPDDNSFVTQDQWDQWAKLDDRTRERYILGKWDLEVKGRFMYAFDPDTQVVDELPYNPEYPLNYCFDFNVDPSCAIVFQTDGDTFFHVLDEVRIENSDTPQVCDELKRRWRHRDPLEQVFGDASGLNRISGLRGHLNQYQVIKQELELPEERFVLASSNPTIADSRVFCNSIFQRFPRVRIARQCKWTIHDLTFVKISRDGEGNIGIQKTGKLEHAPLGAESMGHLLDCVRYGMHGTLYRHVIIPRS